MHIAPCSGSPIATLTERLISARGIESEVERDLSEALDITRTNEFLAKRANEGCKVLQNVGGEPLELMQDCAEKAELASKRANADAIQCAEELRAVRVRITRLSTAIQELAKAGL